MKHFPLNVRKTVQAVGVLFRTDGVKRMNYMRILKLLFLADRKSLQETGRPITGGPVVAMERGPVLEEVYRLIRGQHVDMPTWDAHFHRERYDLTMVGDPDVGYLSRFEIQKLQDVAKQYAEFDEWDLVKETHKLPEWQKNDPGTSCNPIPLKDILEAVGFDKADAAKLEEEAEEKAFMQRILGD